jgi:hypothetical protein
MAQCYIGSFFTADKELNIRSASTVQLSAANSRNPRCSRQVILIPFICINKSFLPPHLALRVCFKKVRTFFPLFKLIIFLPRYYYQLQRWNICFQCEIKAISVCYLFKFLECDSPQHDVRVRHRNSGIVSLLDIEWTVARHCAAWKLTDKNKVQSLAPLLWVQNAAHTNRAFHSP